MTRTVPSPLANRTYRHLLAAHIIALLGTGFTSIALALLAWDLAGDNAGVVLGTALALKMVAYVGIAPIVGAFAYRLPRRTMLVSLDLARAACVLALPFITDIWQIYLVIFVLNACSAGFTPTFQATIPDILPDEKAYTRALSYSRLAYDLENLLTPSLAAMLLIYWSFDTLFAINAVAFVISAILVLSVSIPVSKGSPPATGIIKSISEGLRAYLATPRLRGLLALTVAVSSAGAMMIVNSVVIVREQFGGAETELALVMAASGAGSMIVALFLPRLLENLSDRSVMLTGGFILSVGLTAGMLVSGLGSLALLWLVLGAGSSLIYTPVGRLVTRSATPEDRPRFFAAQFALSHAVWFLTYLAAGLGGAVLELSNLFALFAAISSASTVLALWLWPKVPTGPMEHLHDEVEHEHWHIHDQHHQHGHDHDNSDPEKPHKHQHRHAKHKHSHDFVIDHHHPHWPGQN